MSTSNGFDLTPTLPPKALKRTDDSNSLRQLVGFLNDPNISGAVVPPEAKKEIAASLSQPTIPTDPLFTMTSPVQPTAQPSNSPPETVHTRLLLGRKIFFTGRLCAGKDFVANALNARVFGFADPIYSLAEYFFGVKVSPNEGKSIPGIRRFLQTVGQWGRNEINDQYPLTMERAMFCLMIRSLANQNILNDSVAWGEFGIRPELWADALLKRAATETESRIAVTNCRFANEYKRLIADGWQHFHVTCSPSTWVARIQQKGLKPESPEVRDMSEKMASDLNNSLTKKLSEQRKGAKLQVIWSDANVPPPSNRVYTLPEFIRMANQ